MANELLRTDIEFTSMFKSSAKIMAVLGAFLMSSACASTHTQNTVLEQRAPSAAESIEAVASGPNLITLTSENDFQTTLDLAKAGIDQRDFKTFTVIDHAAGAKSIGETLRPTTLIIFGNPKGGTPLIQSAQTMGIELPLKMLIHEDENGVTHVSWPDMAVVFARNGVEDRDPILEKIQNALQAIATQASTN